MNEVVAFFFVESAVSTEEVRGILRITDEDIKGKLKLAYKKLEDYVALAD
jgi:hypothetical protein